MKTIAKVLIANRGEIAVRIIRTCREMGIQTVAVYSEADRTAYHVRMADEAYYLGPPPASESYLQQERLIDIARRAEAQAIHPGYGFLAENPQFAEKVRDAGLIFIGPPPEAMRIMGDKTAARETMQKAGVPIVPGSPAPLANADEALNVARAIGFPVLLKATAGGGGKGMRMVASESEIASAFRSASSEAQSAFGDGRVYIEKYVQGPRHIEFQVLADEHGNVVHLCERECSIQRRHQKIIEESPSPLMTPELREQMGEAAVKAAQACGYVNAGTIEFLVDQDRHFYFLEMNTRLQVEHPVTEMVVGMDLVRLQLEVAMGKPLPFSQDQVHLQGHAIECRVYAEDPRNHFLPSIGTVEFLQNPDGPGVRVDSGVTSGDEISLYYDPMIAKLIVHGENRSQAIERMIRALKEYRVLGVKTTIPFCIWVMQHERYRTGEFDTHFVPNEYLPKLDELDSDLNADERIAAAVALAHSMENGQGLVPLDQARETDHRSTSAWRIRGWKQLKRV
ncbi:MAG: acetyl-CoA carboxylase biotin carboxylase subunit [candidate division KSB1 bacterium]|nr:acetyl-CoA carboxylase biotin carboxylase subunit [candidate division KSB1 bacterium]MDQ7062818.1 acetyl-CoA carboxylase biotin carboxylase subunit [candidate division KSB1 bacterium]